MKNTFGSSVSMTVFGESHGAEIGVVLDGLCPGLVIDENAVADALSRRRPSSSIDTARREPDHFRIVMLPQADVLSDAIRRMGTFLDGYKQK